MTPWYASSVLVIDLEATCWEKGQEFGQESEVIEIGVARLHIASDQYSVTKFDPLLVQPRYSTISQYCTDLTGHTQVDLDRRGMPYELALERLAELTHLREPWASFGDWDREMFQSQGKRFGCKYPLGITHFNVKALLGLYSGDRRLGLGKALKKMGLTFEGKPHSGADDAYNAARVFGEMILQYRKGDQNYELRP